MQQRTARFTTSALALFSFSGAAAGAGLTASPEGADPLASLSAPQPNGRRAPAPAAAPARRPAETVLRSELPFGTQKAYRVYQRVQADIGKLMKANGLTEAMVWVGEPSLKDGVQALGQISMLVDGVPSRRDQSMDWKGQPVHWQKVTDRSGTMQYDFSGVTTSRSIKATDRNPNPIILSEQERKEYTEDSFNFSNIHSKETQEDLNRRGLIPRRDEEDFAFVIRACNYVKNELGMSYKLDNGLPPRTWRALSKLPTGDCGTFTAMLIQVCRANNIPSRSIGGYTMNPDSKPSLGKPYRAMHEYAEFYSKEIKAWVPVDLMLVIKGLKSEEVVGRDCPPNIQYALINTFSGNSHVLQGDSQPNGPSGIVIVESIVPRLLGRDSNRNLIVLKVRENPERLQLAVRPLTIVENNNGNPNSEPAERTAPTSTVSKNSDVSGPAVSVAPWKTAHFEGGQGNMRTLTSGETVISILKPGQNEWSTQAIATTNSLKDGQMYTVTFMAKADAPRRAVLNAQEDAPPYGSIGANARVITLGTEYQKYQMTFRATSSSGKAVRIVALNLGGEKTAPGIVSLKDLTVQKIEP